MANHVVVLSIVKGPTEGREYVFRRPQSCLVGRGSGCTIRLPNDETHNSISRRHCVFQIDPPKLNVRDLESTNGTFVNGVRLSHDSNPIALKSGDEVALAFHSVIQVALDEVDERSLMADIDNAEYCLQWGICPPCFEIARTPSSLVIRFVGRTVRLEPRYMHVLNKHIDDIVASTERPHIALMMSNIECVDSQMIGQFLKLRQKLVERGGSLRLARIQPHIHEIFQAAELYDVFERSPASNKPVSQQ